MQRMDNDFQILFVYSFSY